MNLLPTISPSSPQPVLTGTIPTSSGQPVEFTFDSVARLFSSPFQIPPEAELSQAVISLPNPAPNFPPLDFNLANFDMAPAAPGKPAGSPAMAAPARPGAPQSALISTSFNQVFSANPSGRKADGSSLQPPADTLSAPSPIPAAATPVNLGSAIPPDRSGIDLSQGTLPNPNPGMPGAPAPAPNFLESVSFPGGPDLLTLRMAGQVPDAISNPARALQTNPALQPNQTGQPHQAGQPIRPSQPAPIPPSIRPSQSAPAPPQTAGINPRPSAVLAGPTPAPFIPTFVNSGSATAAPLPAASENLSSVPAAVPAGAIPVGAVPVGAVPTGAVPTGAVPTGAVPTGAVPANSKAISVAAPAHTAAPSHAALPILPGTVDRVFPASPAQDNVSAASISLLMSAHSGSRPAPVQAAATPLVLSAEPSPTGLRNHQTSVAAPPIPAPSEVPGQQARHIAEVFPPRSPVEGPVVETKFTAPAPMPNAATASGAIRLATPLPAPETGTQPQTPGAVLQTIPARQLPPAMAEAVMVNSSSGPAKLSPAPVQAGARPNGEPVTGNQAAASLISTHRENASVPVPPQNSSSFAPRAESAAPEPRHPQAALENAHANGSGNGEGKHHPSREGKAPPEPQSQGSSARFSQGMAPVNSPTLVAPQLASSDAAVASAARETAVPGFVSFHDPGMQQNLMPGKGVVPTAENEVASPTGSSVPSGGTVAAQQIITMPPNGSTSNELDSAGKKFPVAGQNEGSFTGGRTNFPGRDSDLSRANLSAKISELGSASGLGHSSATGGTESGFGEGAENRTFTRLRLSNEMWSAVEQFRSLNSQDWAVRIRPDQQTQIQLFMKIKDNQLMIQARLERGSADAMVANWGDLQKLLGERGVTLKPLETTPNSPQLPNPSNSFAGQDPKQSSQQSHQHSNMNAREFETPMGKGPARVEPEPAGAGAAGYAPRTGKAWESWA